MVYDRTLDRVFGPVFVWATVWTLVFGLASWPAPARADDEPTESTVEGESAPEAELEAEPEAASGAEASEAEQNPEPVRDEIVVTAQRRDQILQKTPVAISVFDQIALDQRNITDIESLSLAIPNFHYGETLGVARITIRGITNAGGEQAAAFHVDGIYQNSALVPNALTFFDLEAVEVLRGPQGTLGGRNSTGGALFVNSKKPQHEFDAFGDVQLGNYGEVITRAVLNVPIVEDRVAARVSFIQDKHDGYVKNLEYDRTGRDGDNKDLYAVRGQLRVTPSDNVDWVLRSLYSDSTPRSGIKIDGDYPEGIELTPLLPRQDFYRNADPNPDDNRKMYLDTEEQNDTELVNFSSTLTWDPPEMQLLGETTVTVNGGWQHRDSTTFADIDRSNATAFDTGLPLIDADVDVVEEEWVVELDWASANDGPFQWIAGLFYLGVDYEFDSDGTANLPFLNEVPDPDIETTGIISTKARTTAETSSVSGYIDGSYEFFDQLEITGGVRYSWDSKSSERHNQPALLTVEGSPASLCVLTRVDSKRDKDWSEATGRAVAKWQVTDSNMVYGSYSRGYKAGTLQHPVSRPPDFTDPDALAACDEVTTFPNTDPETIDAYEIGTKNSFFDHRLMANLTGFFYDYEHIQIATLVESTVVTENADEAELGGVELELVLFPYEGIMLTANAAYLYSEFTDHERGCLVEKPSTCVEGGFLDFTGNELPRAPEWNATFTAEYRWMTANAGTFTPFLQFYLSDEFYFRPGNLSEDKQDDYWLMDAHVTWVGPNEHLQWEFFVNNALDKEIISSMVISSPLLGSPLLHAYAPPRTFGTRVSVFW